MDKGKAMLLVSTALAVMLGTTGVSAQAVNTTGDNPPVQDAGTEAGPAPARVPAAVQQGTDNADIVVTAQRRDESLSRVPISITAQTQAQLDSKGLRTFGDLARTVPGLNFRADNDLDQPNVSIRGIVSNVGSATTGVYLDDTPIASRYICFFCGFSAFPQLFDLDRVEVLKGPQGTLFGAGSEGGTIRFITPKPSLTTWSGYSRADLGFTRFGDPSWEAGTALGGPIVEDKLGFRASFWTRREGGYIDRVNRRTGATVDDNANHSQSYVGRVALTVAPTDGLTITPAVFFQKNDAANRNAYWEDAGLFRSFNVLAQPSRDRQVIGSVTTNYDMGTTAITAVTSYYDRKQRRIDDYTPILLTFLAGMPTGIPTLPNFTSASNITTKQKTWSQELRFSTDGTARLSATGGLYFMRSRTGFDQFGRDDLESFTQAVFGASVVDVFGSPLVDGMNYIDVQSQRDTEYAVFGEVGYKITPQLKLTAGARLSKTDFDLRIDRDGPTAGGPLSVRRSGGSTPFNPRLSLSYQADTTLVYGTIARGFRIGGGNSSVAQIPMCGSDLAALGVDDVPATYQPDNVWSYELGSKARLGNRGRVSGALFYINWNNMQTNVILPTCGYNYTTNTGKATSKGFEVQASYDLLAGLTASGTAGYTDAKYTQTVTSGPAIIVTDGTPLSTPKWQVTAALDYSRPISVSTTLYARGDYQYASSYTRGYPATSISFDADVDRLAALNFFSARTGVRFSGLDLSLYANNLFDARPRLTRYHEKPGIAEFRDITLRPRTIGATASYRF